MSVSGNTSPLEQSSDAGGFVWDVQEILAERVTARGDTELLVVWKTSWIPQSNMIADGPVLRAFMQIPKCKFVSAAGTISIPVEPGTTLAQECAFIAAYAESELALHISERDRSRGQSLGGGAKFKPVSYRKHRSRKH